MRFDDLISSINKSIDNLDFVSARKYIEENIDILKDCKHLLNSNAREILKFLIKQQEDGVKALSRSELNIMNAINTYAYKFDVTGIKILLKNNARLFLRNDAVAYLNSDAKTILAGMKVINE